MWEELVYESWNVGAGELDTAIGVKLDTALDGTDANGTVAIITLTAGTTDGLTKLDFRPDGLDGYATMFSDLNAQPVWPYVRGSQTVLIDGTPPAAFAVTVSHTCTKTTTTLTFSTTDSLSGIDHYELFVDSVSKGTVTSPYPLNMSAYATGSYSVVIRAYDRSGNTRDSSPVTVNVDKIAPVISNIVAEQGAGNSVLCPNLAVRGVVDLYVDVTDEGCAPIQTVPLVTVAGISPVSYVGFTGDTFHYQVTVLPTTANGSHAITVDASDALGNASSDNSQSICVDKNQITGQVQLESFVGSSRTVTFVATGGLPKSWTLTLSFSGGVAGYALKNVPAGTTGLSAKTAWNLRNKLAVSLDGNGQGTADFTGAEKLLGGDLNADNMVTLLDYSAMKSYWNTNNPVADIDGSGQVQILDYSIMKSNWFQVGDGQ